MSKLTITQGEWKYRDHFSDGIVETEETIIGHLMKWGSPEDELQANAVLICDAGNTYQFCGLLPSELLGKTEQLKAALFDMVNQFAYRVNGGLSTGGLSALEDAFDVLGLPDPCKEEEFQSVINNAEK